MKKSNLLTISIVIITIIAIFLIVQLLLFSLFPVFIGKSEAFWEISANTDYMNTACVAASALFTAFAFGATFYAIRQQQKETHKQKENTLRATTLSVFTKTFNELQNEPAFIKAQEYVLYNLKPDIETIKSNKQTDDGQIGTKEIKEFSKDNYGLVMYFLTKMEYIGIIVKKEYIDEIILDYFGKIIIDSYYNLENILRTDRHRMKEHENGRDEAKTYFIHYFYLFKEAEKRKPNFMSESQYYINHKKWPSKKEIKILKNN